ncbi:MAG: EpsG family protein [Sphaerotilus sp.]|nr:EpsG family protein [Sphaerotilus sp.]
MDASVRIGWRRSATWQTLDRSLNLLGPVLIWWLAFLSFARAGDDFSYDYIHYIGYFKEMMAMGGGDLVENIADRLPLPYLYIPPTGLFELGFALPAWALLKLTGDAAVTYALIAATSLALRCAVMRRMGTPWPLVLLINVYAATLFEANAVRLGCALTVLMLGLARFQRGERGGWTWTILFGAAALHLQVLLFSVTFLALFVLLRTVRPTQIRLLVIALLLIAVTGVAVLAASALGAGAASKLEDYADTTSAATGLTIVSVLGLAVLGIAGLQIIATTSLERHETRTPPDLWTLIVLSTIPALVFLIFATSLGALGDRIWQLAFTLLAATAFIQGGSSMRLQRQLIVITLLVSNLNVIVRYPLSNLFHPLVPYTHIVPQLF